MRGFSDQFGMWAISMGVTIRRITGMPPWLITIAFFLFWTIDIIWHLEHPG